ncbi:MAG TPA: hypothetical protein VHG89_04880 [Verrucomicrobiae bacterium]|nr:hypothetical protein [Verrucomicrobiae bacterium]
MSKSNTTLFSGVDATATFLDGTTKTVRVRQLPARLMPDYSRVQNNEAEMIELACGLDAATVDTLTPESHVALIADIERANEDFFSRWLARLKARVEKLIPGATAALPSPLPTSSPSAASKPA